METPPGARGTVLVVDDDAQVRALAARALAEDGFDVLQAPDANTALRLLQDFQDARICLVVTDIVMPGMHGDELGRLLQRLFPTLPVLYISGCSQPHFDFLSAEDLRHCWLDKPFSPPRLLKMAHALCAQAKTLA